MTDSLWYTVSNVLTKGVVFLMVPLYTTYFSPEEYGIIDLIIVSGSIISIVVGLEIHQSVARFFPEEKTFEDKKNIVSTALWSVCILYFVFCLVTIPFSKRLSYMFFHSEEYDSILVVAIVSFGLNFLYYFSSSQLKWQMKTKMYTIVNLIYGMSILFFTYVFLSFFDGDIKSVFVAQILASLVSILLSYISSREYYSFIFKFDKFIELVSFSMPLVFSTLLLYAMLYADRVMINLYMSIKEVGLYGVAFKVASVVSLFSTGIQTALTPILYNHYENEQTSISVARVFNYVMIGAISIVSFLFFFSKNIVLWFSNEAYIEAYPAVPWIAISILFSAIINFTPGIFIAKKTNYILYINIVCFFLNIILNLFLIKYYGFIGAAYSTAISSFVYFFLYYSIGQRHYFIPFIWTKF